jgi:hypothetical protein
MAFLVIKGVFSRKKKMEKEINYSFELSLTALIKNGCGIANFFYFVLIYFEKKLLICLIIKSFIILFY